MLLSLKSSHRVIEIINITVVYNQRKIDCDKNKNDKARKDSQKEIYLIFNSQGIFR